MRRPRTFAGRLRLETLADARARNQQRIDNLTGRAPEIASALEKCRPGTPCDMLICAHCSRAYRSGWIRGALAIGKSYPGQHQFATIYLDAFPAMGDILLFRMPETVFVRASGSR